ncbi:TonB-dependent receptor [Niveispirillum sp. KHB5.9]|uniref:TonB-dependent receptor n=1 Tax=Niveispirillum sp. KHB5.9 TaxID=3400269 RepID=UPI003A8A8DE6
MHHTFSLGFRRAARLLATTAIVSTGAVSAVYAGAVTGTVTDVTGTSALRGAEVTLVELGQSATVQADGSFRFASVPAGTYKLHVRYSGAEDQVQQITVPQAGDISAQFALAGANTELAEILVVGQRANLASSISRQRSSDSVQTTLSRDSIGNFPDQNVAESIRRAPGVNTLNDQGEGRFVSVRGLDPNLNSASINGNRILATGGDDRAVAMDVIPSELIESIDIKKSLTPDMDADTIGASIEIKTTSAFDRKTGFVSGSIEGSYNDLNEKTSPKGSIDFSTRLTDNIGVAGGFSYYDRKFSTDNVEADGWEETSGGLYAEDLEYRDYDVRRKRYGGTLNFDFRAGETTSLYLRSLYSKFDDTEKRTRLVFDLADADIAVNGSRATFGIDDSGDTAITVERDLKDRREVQSVKTFSVGGETFLDKWTLTYDAAYSQARQWEDGSFDPIVFQQEFEDEGSLGVAIDYANLKKPAYSITRGSAAFLDASNYEFDKLERTTDENSKDEEYSFKADAAYDIDLDEGSAQVKFGGKARLRDKSLSFIYDVFDGYDGDFTLADVIGKPSYGLADIGTVPDLKGVRGFVRTNLGKFELDQLDTDFASAAENFDASEDIYAGYVQGRYDNGPLRLIGGVRVEQTKVELSGTRLELVEEGATVGGVELDEDTLFTTPVSFKKDYTDWMPSLNLRYELGDDVVARAAYFKSIMRPSFGKMAPRFVIEENDDNERSGEFGNPELNPYKAHNFDATLEYYFASNSVIQAGVFYKKINDFIVDAEFENGSFAGIGYDEAVIPVNGDKAKVKGIELAYAQAFTELPAPFDGLLVNANYTYTDAEGDVLGRTVSLPASSKHTANFALGYEKGPITLRASLTYRSGYLDELGGDAEEDRWIKPHRQWDFSAKYRVTENVRLFAELVNANDATYTAYNKIGGRQNLLQYEEYSWTGKFGAKFNF